MLLERKKRHRAINHEGSWAVSYVDMLTLLLCFFIIFFNAKHITPDDEPTALKKVIQSLQVYNATTASVVGSGVGSGNSSSASSGLGVGNGLIDEIKTAFDQNVPAKTIIKGKALEIAYSDVSFFESGSTQINLLGKQSTEKIIQILYAHRASIKITVQGHTDPSKVRGTHNQFSDNWELSVLRATAVLKIFLKSGFDQDSLSAEGFADTQPQEGAVDDFSKYRNITFRIEQKVKP